MEISSPVLHASAIRFLEEGGEQEAADMLRNCRVSAHESGNTWWDGDECLYAIHVEIFGSREAYETLSDKQHNVTAAIWKALEAVKPPLTYIKHRTEHAWQVDEEEALPIIYRTRSTSNASAVVEDIWLNPPPDCDLARTRRILRTELVDNAHSTRARVRACYEP